jgi:hypothetical protein
MNQRDGGSFYCFTIIEIVSHISQRIGRRVGQAQYVIQFTVGQQSGIGGNRRTAKLEHQAAVEIEPQHRVI